jgi:hypothetical protein
MTQQWEPAPKWLVRIKGDSPYGRASTNSRGQSTVVHARDEVTARKQGADFLGVSIYLVDVFPAPR